MGELYTVSYTEIISIPTSSAISSYANFSDLFVQVSSPLCEEVIKPYKDKIAEAENLLKMLHKCFDELITLHVRMSTERNRCTAVINSRLPADVLRSIFIEFIDTYASAKDRGIAALIIAGVCSHWRTIALNFPAMWNKIDCEAMSDYRCRLFCDRAKNYSLTMSRCDIFHREDVRTMVTSKLSGIQVLGIAPTYSPRPGWNVPPVNQANILRTLTEAPAEPPGLMLKSLSCCVRAAGGPMVLEAPLFQGQTPRLRRLCLDGVRMPWNRGFYSNLVVLSIESIALRKSSQSDEDICLVLLDCPHLRELTLASDYDSQDSPSPEEDPLLAISHPRSERIHLKYLRYLSLEMPPHYGHHILAGIAADFVDDVHVTLRTTGRSRHGPIMSALCQPETFPYVIFRCPTSLSITVKNVSHSNCDRYCSIVGYSDGTTDADGPYSHRCLEWGWSSYKHGTDHFDITRQMIQAGRPHMREVLQSLILWLSPDAVVGHHDYVLDLLLPCRYLQVVGEFTATLIVHHQVDDELERTDWSNLERFTVCGDELAFETMCAILDWGLRRSSLRTIIFMRSITVVFPSRSDLGIIESRIEKANSAGIEVQWDHHLYRFNDEV